MIKYIVFCVVSFFSVCVAMFFCQKKGAVSFREKNNCIKSLDDEIAPYNGKKTILMTIAFFIFAFCVQVSLYNSTSLINFIKLYGVFVAVFTAGIIDSKLKIIPNAIILFGVTLRGFIYIYEIISKAEIKEIFINDAIGFAIGFVFLSIVHFVSKGSLGFGDVKLFGVIGMTCGAFCTYSTLFLSLVVSAIFSIANVAMKKMGRKDSFPFGPCIAIGYIVSIFVKSY